MKTNKLRSLVGTMLAAVAVAGAGVASAQTSILNVSYDVARELYKDINPAFAASWQAKGNPPVTINQSHGGSSKQVGAVIAGLEADVVTMNQVPDVQQLVKAGLVNADWQKRLPNDAAPYTTTTVFVVRKGNPKGIKDWPDLIKPGMQVIVPNPKVTGNGRYTYLAAWGFAIKNYKTEDKARDFVKALFVNVPVLDGGGRGATTTFTQRNMGDVLVTFENEAILLDKEVGGDQFDIVYPSLSVDAPAPVTVVDKVVDKRGTRKVSSAYLEYLWSPEGQEIIAKHYLRPRNAAVMKKYAKTFPAVNTFSVEKLLGPWDKVMKEQFADGGVYDQIMTKR